jgi:diguanylate cyclase (GGDEF)-like protein
VKLRRQIEVIDNRQMENLRVFHEVARALTSNLELEPLLLAIMTQMEEFFGPERWSLLMVDEETNELYYALSAGVDDTSFRNMRIRMGEGIAGYVAQTGNPLIVPNVQLDHDWAIFAAKHSELNLHSIACLPILHGGRTLGVLQLHNSKLDLLPDSSIAFLRVMCDYAAIALQNARSVKLIHHLSITDDCTGLFNARYLYTMLEQEIAPDPNARVVAIQPCFSLLFFDLDHFKSVNDTHGHLVGSRLLSEIGGVIKRTLGPEHAAFRYGGDEFVAFLPGADKARAKEIATRFWSELRTTPLMTKAGLDLRLTGSFGVATFPEDGDNIAGIIRSADTMMYQAKALGRDRIVVAGEDDAAAPVELSRGSRHAGTV